MGNLRSLSGLLRPFSFCILRVLWGVWVVIGGGRSVGGELLMLVHSVFCVFGRRGQ